MELNWRDPEAKELYNRHFAKHGIGQKANVAVTRTRNQALAFGGGPTTIRQWGGCERGPVGITDSKKGQHPYQPVCTETVLGDLSIR